MTRHLIIIGEMGSGKTTTGSGAADELGWEFRDSDDWIERLHGRTSGEIAANDGVERLHEIELVTLLDMLAAPEPTVVSPAASILDSPEGIAAITSHIVVWLDAEPLVRANRIGQSDHRRKTTVEALRALAERRTAAYQTVTDVRVDTGARDAASSIAAAVVTAQRA